MGGAGARLADGLARWMSRWLDVGVMEEVSMPPGGSQRRSASLHGEAVQMQRGAHTATPSPPIHYRPPTLIPKPLTPTCRWSTWRRFGSWPGAACRRRCAPPAGACCSATCRPTASVGRRSWGASGESIATWCQTTTTPPPAGRTAARRSWGRCGRCGGGCVCGQEAALGAGGWSGLGWAWAASGLNSLCSAAPRCAVLAPGGGGRAPHRARRRVLPPAADTEVAGAHPLHLGHTVRRLGAGHASCFPWLLRCLHRRNHPPAHLTLCLSRCRFCSPVHLALLRHPFTVACPAPRPRPPPPPQAPGERVRAGH